MCAKIFCTLLWKKKKLIIIIRFFFFFFQSVVLYFAMRTFLKKKTKKKQGDELECSKTLLWISPDFVMLACHDARLI